MGVSTDGLLFYGIDYGEDILEHIPDEEHGLWEEDEERWLAKRLGCDSDAWKARAEFLKDVPVEFVRHCSGEFSMYALAIKASVTRANRGYPKAVTTDRPDSDSWRDELWSACRSLGLPQTEPQWWLASMWW